MIRIKDLRVQQYPSISESGRIENGIKITHVPSGVYVVCDVYREQYKNKDKALNMLKDKFNLHE